MFINFFLGVGINGGVGWIEAKSLSELSLLRRFFVTFGGIIFSLAFSLILAIPLWIFSSHVTWLYAGVANLIYFNAGATIFNLLPIPPMDCFYMIIGFLPVETQINVTKRVNQFWWIIGFLILLVVIVAFGFG